MSDAILHGKVCKNPCVLCSAAAYCCGAVAPRAIAALLGRFLPRLGPLVHSSGPFFFWASFRHSGASKARPLGALAQLIILTPRICDQHSNADTGATNSGSTRTRVSRSDETGFTPPRPGTGRGRRAEPPRAHRPARQNPWPPVRSGARAPGGVHPYRSPG